MFVVTFAYCDLQVYGSDKVWHQPRPEGIHRRAPWRTREAVELATLDWVSWFNHHRLLEPLGYIPPAEAEANYYKQLSSQAVPA
jgi:transposase InsO family protein